MLLCNLHKQCHPCKMLAIAIACNILHNNLEILRIMAVNYFHDIKARFISNHARTTSGHYDSAGLLLGPWLRASNTGHPGRLFRCAFLQLHVKGTRNPHSCWTWSTSRIHRCLNWNPHMLQRDATGMQLSEVLHVLNLDSMLWCMPKSNEPLITLIPHCQFGHYFGRQLWSGLITIRPFNINQYQPVTVR